MRRKELSGFFAEVDSEVKVINGDTYCRQRNKSLIRLVEKPATEAYRYEPAASTEEDWEKTSGTTCPICRQPTMRLLSYGFLGKRKARPEYTEPRARLLEYKARIFEPRQRR